MTEQELRFECLKMAFAISGDGDPRPMAEALADYVRNGLRKAPCPSPTPAQDA